MADGCHIEIKKLLFFRNLWPILTEFCGVMHIDHLDINGWFKIRF